MAINNYKEILGKARESISQKEEKIVAGMTEIELANDAVDEALKQSTPQALWETCWYEGEVCCLFADSNCGKSILAYQIADEISRKQKVLYFDFELTAKQFQLRYFNKELGPYRFSDKFYRGSIDPFKMEVENFEEQVIRDIEQGALRSGAKVVIVDNISYLCINQDKSDQAGLLMKELIAMKRKHNFSLLVIAHTPKRPLNSPLTQNDLAGSKKLFNFVDSCFAISFCADRPSYRYIKQLKVRYGEARWVSHSVMVCKLEQKDNFLGFTLIGTEPEADQLKKGQHGSNDVAEERKRQIIELYEKGMKQVLIADQTNCTTKYVSKVVRSYRDGTDRKNLPENLRREVE